MELGLVIDYNDTSSVSSLTFAVATYQAALADGVVDSDSRAN